MDQISPSKGSFSTGPSSSRASLEELPRLNPFNQFDIVEDYSDHHFANKAKDVKNVRNAWTKKIQQDWKILETNLPETIFIRVYEQRLDLLRAVIIGPSGTPYHDGLFFFDFHFPANYPQVPPKAYYHSFGLRLNPNLYASGTVCLSLLDTWHGKGCEKWNPKSSTMLQILVSIQALVLNSQPYFNEPAFKGKANTSQGKKASIDYNETTFFLSCNTILYVIRKPPKNFEDFVNQHFREHARPILAACKAYMKGVQIGFAHEEGENYKAVRNKSQSTTFNTRLNQYFEALVNQFRIIGVNCEDFLAKTEKGGEGIEVVEQNVKADDSASTSKKPAKSKSWLKRFSKYLLKLGKKVLPLEK